MNYTKCQLIGYLMPRICVPPSSCLLSKDGKRNKYNKHTKQNST